MNYEKSKTITPQQQRSIKSKKRILDSAKKIFAEKGLHGGRIDQIANLSDVNKQRIYAYFGSKMQLYREVLKSIYSRISENKALANLKEKDIPNLTSLIIDAFFDFHERNPLFWRLLSWENLNGGKSLRPSDWENIQAGYIQKIRQLYKTGQKKGTFRSDIDFSTYIITLFAATYFYHSNQLTISNLLNLKLESASFKTTFTKQLTSIYDKGITS